MSQAVIGQVNKFANNSLNAYVEDTFQTCAWHVWREFLEKPQWLCAYINIEPKTWRMQNKYSTSCVTAAWFTPNLFYIFRLCNPRMEAIEKWEQKHKLLSHFKLNWAIQRLQKLAAELIGSLGNLSFSEISKNNSTRTSRNLLFNSK